MIFSTLTKLFKKVIKDTEMDSERQAKFINQLLRGVNRFASGVTTDLLSSFEECLQDVFRLAHVSPFKTRIQLLYMVYQAIQSNLFSKLADHFYRVLYELVQSPEAFEASSVEVLFDLLYNSLQSDIELGRFAGFIHRILQTTSLLEPHTICAALVLVSKLFEANPSVQLALLSDSVLAKTKKAFGELKENGIGDDDDLEHFEDAPDSEEEEGTRNDKEPKRQEKKEEMEKKKPEVGSDSGYNPLKREPKYSGGDSLPLYELVHLRNHYHPSVSQFAEALLSKNKIDYSRNPLQDFALANFLDRLSNKTPKQKNARQAAQGPVNSAEGPITFKMVLDPKSSSEISAESMFIKRYFQEQMAREDYMAKRLERKEKKKRPEKKGEGMDGEDVDNYADELFEKELKDMGDEDEDVFEDIDDFGDDGDDDEDFNKLFADEDDGLDENEEEIEGVKVEKRHKGKPLTRKDKRESGIPLVQVKGKKKDSKKRGVFKKKTKK